LGWFGKYRVSSYGHLTGLRALPQPGRLQFKPFTLSGVQREFDEHLPYEEKLDLGFDAKYRLTTNLTTDISFNTDFAQVEADQEQANLTRFELFFPEKRDFFLEGAGIFRFGERAFSPLFPASVLFFSRRIGLSEDNEPVSLYGGVRITGKTAGFNVGMLNMTAKRTSYINDDDEPVTVPKTNFSVLRIQKDILRNSSIGFMGLNQESLDDEDYDRAVGVDANIFLSNNAQVGGFLATTSSPDYSGRNFAAYGDFLYIDDFKTILLTQNTIGDNFEPEMGFLPRTGIRKTEVNVGISPRPGILDIRQIFFFNDFYYITNQQSRLETRTNFSGFHSLFNSGAALFGIFIQNYEWLDEDFEIHDDVNILPGIYQYNNFFGEFQSDQSKPISGRLGLNAGDFYDGDIVSYVLGANLKFGSKLTMSFDLNYNDVNVTAGSFRTTIIGTRILYTFSPKLFAKAFVQWNSDTNDIIGNFLVNFIHTPGSDLFFVYNEELNNEGSLNTDNRTALLKFTYLFNL
jgi:hypothetical protein